MSLHPEVKKMIASYFASGNAVPIMSRPMSREALEGIAALAEEKEREECAKVCDEYPRRDPAEDGNGYWATQDCAAAIRRRGKP